MVTKPGRRWRSAAGLALAVTLVLGAPMVARAQLLPNLPNRKRQRPPCVTEPPFYSTVKHQYFGYYPTCWRRFPPGWACPCPNPELPNFQASLEKQPLRAGEDTGGTGPRDGSGDEGERERPGRRPGTDTTLPPMPREERSPFDLPANPRGDSMPPLDDSPLPDRERPAPAPAPDRRAPAPRSEAGPELNPTPPAPAAAAAATVERLDLPPIAEAAPEVPPLETAGAQARAGDDVAPAPPELAVATPTPTPTPAAPAPTIPASAPIATGAEATPPPIPLSPAAQAPARRSVIGGLLNRVRRR